MGLFDKLKKMFSFSFNVKADARELSAEQSRGLALGLIYAAEGNLPINALTCEADAASARDAVAGPWEATDARSAKANFAFLLGGGHDTLYRLVMEKYASYEKSGDRATMVKTYEHAVSTGRAEATALGIDPGDFEAALKKWASAIALGLSDRIPDSARTTVPTSIAAWDAARVVQCSRLFVDAGFVTPDEAWAAIAEATRISHPAYASWKEFSDAFLVGRYFWLLRNGNSRDDAASGLTAFSVAVEDIEKAPESPWKSIAW